MEKGNYNWLNPKWIRVYCVGPVHFTVISFNLHKNTSKAQTIAHIVKKRQLIPRMFTFTVVAMVRIRPEVQTQFYMVVIFFILSACVQGKIGLVLDMFLIIPRVHCYRRRCTKHSVYLTGFGKGWSHHHLIDSCHHLRIFSSISEKYLHTAKLEALRD